MVEQILRQFTSPQTAAVLNTQHFGNTLFAYGAAALIFVLLIVIFKVVQTSIVGRLQQLSDKTATDLDDMLIHLLQSIRPSLYIITALYGALQFLNLSARANTAITAIFIAWVVFQLVHSVEIVIGYAARRVIKREKESETQSAVRVLTQLVKWLLWLFGALLILSNLGVDVTSLVAGLGIGGVAVALAAQNILGDLFSSFVIYFDKPFVVGDFIIVGEHLGTVEKIGIKTTRLRALQGEEIVISNQELTGTRIQNFKKMQKRRVVFGFGVLYETPARKLKNIPGIVKKIIKNTPTAQIDRVHFQKFGDSALVYEVVYFVGTGDYNKYMDTQEQINIALVEEFAKESIEMAYPTRTVYLKNGDGH